MSLVVQELTLSTMDVTSGSRTHTEHEGMSLVDQELTLITMDVTNGSRTYTKHDGCH